jgi:hypothetical protein
MITTAAMMGASVVLIAGCGSAASPAPSASANVRAAQAETLRAQNAVQKVQAEISSVKNPSGNASPSATPTASTTPSVATSATPPSTIHIPGQPDLTRPAGLSDSQWEAMVAQGNHKGNSYQAPATPSTPAPTTTSSAGYTPDQVAVAGVYEQFSAAFSSGDYNAAAAELSAGAKQSEVRGLQLIINPDGQLNAPEGTPLTPEQALRVGRENGESSFDLQRSGFTRGHVVSVQVSGDTATIATDDGSGTPVTLQKVGGTWQLLAEYTV